ncbi:hypothetical protein AVEN_18529-1 [Araneus ventricosus]|uniref:Uncharacterized protein n=1 Tax=Araneus ventricosus TaxID=182803 RepID=A0A4Y2WDB6_ARAVE|nr:hypothetical protein AVEN_18529-1 [Araneus ventricosus]
MKVSWEIWKFSRYHLDHIPTVQKMRRRWKQLLDDSSGVSTKWDRGATCFARRWAWNGNGCVGWSSGSFYQSRIENTLLEMGVSKSSLRPDDSSRGFYRGIESSMLCFYPPMGSLVSNPDDLSPSS